MMLPTPGVCRVCGCSEAFACDCGCAWADAARTLCTRCAGAMPGLAVAAGLDQMAAILVGSGGALGGLRLVALAAAAPTYRVFPGAAGNDAILCRRCGAISYHPRDVAERYCARCQQFHDDRRDDG